MNRSGSTRSASATAARPQQWEALKSRQLMSAATLVQQTNLVSDQPGVALNLDATLQNAWGISAAPVAGAFWVSSAGHGLAELYFGDFQGSAIAQPFKVTVPGGLPTGQVFNINQPVMGTGNSTDFSITDGTNTGASVFMFATKTGKIVGWNPTVGHQIPFSGATISDQGQTAFQADDGAIYTGLAAGDVGAAHFLYAADFHNGKIDVLDGQFHKTALAGSFTDSHMPAGFKPFNVQNLQGKLYVTYAQEDPTRVGGQSLPGAGKGFVDVFSTSGQLIQRVASGGALNAPWGLAIAPSSFGSAGGDLLVGNFGDGHITAFDPAKRFHSDGQLMAAKKTPLAIQGLWGLQFGNGVTSGDANSLYFAAGPNGGAHALFGSLKIQPHGHGHAVRRGAR
jgi:uncharacterized protein (TIGR03118 family)